MFAQIWQAKTVYVKIIHATFSVKHELYQKQLTF